MKPIQLCLIRHYNELFCLIIHQRVLRSVLIKEFDITSKTLQSDYLFLCELAPEFGVRLHQNNLEIYTEIIDSQIYHEKYVGLNLFYNAHKHNISNTIIRSNYIARKLLLSNDFHSVDEFAEELNVSKSSLREELKVCRTLYKNYNLNLISSPHYGITVKGNELDKRICALNLINFLDTRILFTNSSQFFDKDAFENEEISNTYLNQILLKLKLINYQTTTESRFMLANYIRLFLGRIKSGANIQEFDSETISILKGREEYQLCADVFAAIIDPHLDVEQEICALTSIVILSKNYRAAFLHHQILDADFLAISPLIDDTLNLLIPYLRDENNCYETKVVLVDIAMKCLYNKKLNLPILVKYALYGTAPQLKKHPFVFHILTKVQTLFSSYFDYTVPFAAFNSLILALHYAIQFIQLPLKEYHIALSSIYGNANNHFTEAILRKYFPDAQLTIDRFETTRVNRMDNRQYNLIISDGLSYNTLQNSFYFACDYRAEDISHLIQRIYLERINLKHFHALKIYFETMTQHQLDELEKRTTPFFRYREYIVGLKECQADTEELFIFDIDDKTTTKAKIGILLHYFPCKESIKIYTHFFNEIFENPSMLSLLKNSATAESLLGLLSKQIIYSSK